MKDKLQMSSMGEITFFLGLQVTQKEDGIFISQDKHVAKILKKFNYTDVKSASTPVDLEKPLVKDGDADDVDVHLYRSMIGSLMYLTTSRPDIMFAVCACARFQVAPKTSHLLAIKRIFRYLKGKPTLGLWYSRHSPFELVAYTDSDYAGATQDRKSTTEDLLTKGFDAGRHVKKGRDTKIPQSSGPPVNVGDEAVHKELGDRMERAATTASSLEAKQDIGSGPRCQDTILGGIDAQTSAKTTAWNEFSVLWPLALIMPWPTKSIFKSVQVHFDDMIQAFLLLLNRHPLLFNHLPLNSRRNSLGESSKRLLQFLILVILLLMYQMRSLVPQSKIHASGEDRLKLTELMDMYTKLSERVLDLEHTKTAQAKEIINLKLRVKKLEKKAGLRTHKFKRLYKDTEVSLVDEIPGRRSDDAEIFDTDVLFGNEVFAKNDMIEKDQDVIPKEVSTATPYLLRLLPHPLYKYNLLKSKSYDEIQKLFDNEIKRVNTFIPMDSEVVVKSKEGPEGAPTVSKERGGKWNLIRQRRQEKGLKGFYHLIRADGSTNRYSSMIRMLQSISREDLETLWKLVKTKYGNTSPEDDYERVFWGDLNTAGTKVNAAGLQLLEELLLSKG
ncbi:uncharacterized mitochondrial protein-like protein [Tanacetum coccineum]